MPTDAFCLLDAVVLKNELGLKEERVMKEKNRNGVSPTLIIWFWSCLTSNLELSQLSLNTYIQTRSNY